MTATLESIADQIRTGRHDEARRGLEAIKPTSETRNELTFLRGYLQELSFDREGALKAYQALLGQDPDHCEAAFRAAVLCDLGGDEEWRCPIAANLKRAGDRTQEHDGRFAVL